MINKFFDKSKEFSEQLVSDYEKHLSPALGEALLLLKNIAPKELKIKEVIIEN